MLDLKHNISLKPYNTFGIDVTASQYVAVTSVVMLQEVISHAKSEGLDCLILGGGSNMLLTQDFAGLVIHIQTQGKSIVAQDDMSVTITVQAGELWHEMVMWSLEQGYTGLENLALIPGTVGAAPIQNIGAYGVEAKDVIQSVDVLDLTDNKLKTIAHKNCQFGYRNSVFKQNKGRYIIWAVTLKLAKGQKALQTSYGAIQQLLQERQIDNPTSFDVAQAVIDIRQSKLPDPNDIGNSGSFFKNPVISQDHFGALQRSYPNMPFYKLEPLSGQDQYKIPAGWLIEQTGYKGQRFGDAGVHDKQALVLVNYGQATGAEILNLAHTIKQQINAQFNIALDFEVNII